MRVRVRVRVRVEVRVKVRVKVRVRVRVRRGFEINCRVDMNGVCMERHHEQPQQCFQVC